MACFCVMGLVSCLVGLEVRPLTDSRSTSVTMEKRLSESGNTPFADDASAAETAVNGKTIPIVDEGQIDPLYQAKAQILNDAIQEIGMGKYQWHLFCVAGFGWFSDNVSFSVRLNIVMARCHWSDFHATCI
jgi:hypothetical protein